MAGDQIESHHNKIPDNLDILISHGPPFGVLDRNNRGQHSGCTSLLKRIEIVKPRYLICGHIHDGYGAEVFRETTVINASILNGRNRIANKPIVISV